MTKYAQDTRSDEGMSNFFGATLWKNSSAVQVGDPVWTHFHLLGLYLSEQESKVIRCHIPPDGRQGSRESYSPQMLALITDQDGNPESVLQMKLDVANAVMTSKVTEHHLQPGSAIRLSNPNDVLGLAIGVSNAVGARSASGIPCWALTHEYSMSDFVPPDGVSKVVIFEPHGADDYHRYEAEMLRDNLFAHGIDVELIAAPFPGMQWRCVPLLTSVVQFSGNPPQNGVAEDLRSRLREISRMKAGQSNAGSPLLLSPPA